VIMMGIKNNMVQDDITEGGRHACECDGSLCSCSAASLGTNKKRRRGTTHVMKMAATKKTNDYRWCRRLLSGIHIYCARLVLEVFGSVGAIWGSMQVLGLRTSDNESYWRVLASLVGAAFLMRLVWQELLFNKDCNSGCCCCCCRGKRILLPWHQHQHNDAATLGDSTTAITSATTTTTTAAAAKMDEEAADVVQEVVDKKKKNGDGQGDSKQKVCSSDFLLETLAVKFVLEVLGSAGAIW
jgi:hypothetical protein